MTLSRTTFGIGYVGGAAIEKTVVISNEGGSPVARRPLEIKSNATGQFSFVSTPPSAKTLQPGDREQVKVRLRCTRPGSASAVFVAGAVDGQSAAVSTLVGICTSR